MNDELSRRREECLIRLAQHKEDIKRVAATGIPLLHLDTDLVSMCLNFVSAELAIMPPPLEYSMNDDELARRRIECLIRLGQHKEAIKRISKTGIPLLHLDTELVSMCLHFALGRIGEDAAALAHGAAPFSACRPQTFKMIGKGLLPKCSMTRAIPSCRPTARNLSPISGLRGNTIMAIPTNRRASTSPMKYDDGDYKPTYYDDGPQGITSPMKYDNGDYKPICYDDGPQYITSPVKYDDGKSKEE